MKKGLFAVVLACICAMVCMFGLVACNDEEQTIAVESVTLNKTELTLEVGGEETLTVTVAPDDATDKAVTWTSDNTAIATVENGKVTAVAAGRATITAKAGDKTAACAVTIKEALTEDTDFDALVSDKVTEDEWKAAFSESAFKNCTIKHSGTSGDFEGISLKISGKYRCLHAFESDIYLIETDDNNYMFMYNDGVVVANPNWPEMSRDERAWYFSYSVACPDFNENYNRFTYDNDKGEYVCSTAIKANSIMEPNFNVEYSDIHIKFHNKNLAYISMESKKIEICIYDNGSTQVVIPPEIEEQINA